MTNGDLLTPPLSLAQGGKTKQVYSLVRYPIRRSNEERKKEQISTVKIEVEVSFTFFAGFLTSYLCHHITSFTIGKGRYSKEKWGINLRRKGVRYGIDLWKYIHTYIYTCIYM